MAVKNDPHSVIKAEDAQPLMGLDPESLAAALTKLHFLRGFRVTSAVVFDGTPRMIKHTIGGTSEDIDIFHEWLTNLVATTAKKVQSEIGAVIFAVRSDGVIDTATWGRDATACISVAQWRDEALRVVTYAPFQTWYGWRNKGKPRRLRTIDYEGLSKKQKAYVDRVTDGKAVSGD